MDSPDARADIRRRAREAAADKLAKNQLTENPQLDEARERTPCTSAAVEGTPGTAGEELPRKSDSPDARGNMRQRAREAAADQLAENQLAKNPKLAKARVSTPCKSRKKARSRAARREPSSSSNVSRSPSRESSF